MTHTLSPEIERSNMRRLYQEIAWMGLAFAMEWYFLQVFAIRMGATPGHLGMITAGRALLLAIGSGLAGRWQRRYPNLIRALSLPILVSRILLYLGVALSAFAPAYQVDLMVAMVVLSALPGGISQGCFLGMLPSALSERTLGKVVALRTALLNVTILISVLIFGQLLDHVAFPINYQIAFGVAFLASLISWWDIRSLQIADVPRPETGHKAANKINVWQNRDFVRYIIVVFAICMGVFLTAPLIQFQLVRGLGASDTWVSIFGLCEMAAGAVATYYMMPLTKRFGTVKLIIITTFLTFLQPLILGLTPTLPPFIIGSLAFGGGWLALNVLLYNRLVEIVPTEGFPEYASMFQMMINVALFAGPLVSTFLIEHWLSVPVTLLIVAGVRFGAAILSWALGSRRSPVSSVSLASPASQAEAVAEPNEAVKLA